MKMDCVEIRFSGHAVVRLFERSLTKTAVQTIIQTGEVIADYPDDTPYPSCLLLGFIDKLPVHVVLARDTISGICFVITAYRPDSTQWTNDYKRRKTP